MLVLVLQCFLHCKSCQLPCSCVASGDDFQDDLYLPLAATALHGTDINPSGGESSHDPSRGEGSGSESITCLSAHGEAAEEECEGIALVFTSSRPLESHM